MVYDNKQGFLFSGSCDNTIKVWHMVGGKSFDPAQNRPFDTASPTQDRLKHLQTIDMQSLVRSLVILDDNEKQKEFAQQDLKERIGYLANNFENLFFTQEQEVKKINIDNFTSKTTTLLATNTLLFN